MKKVSAFVLLMALLFSFSLILPPTKNDVNETDFAFVLPKSLKIIEDEAFERIAAESISFSNSLLSIGERAFANNRYLKIVSIPESVKYIGDHAFDESKDLVIYGLANSYVAEWANEHDISFVSSENVPDYSKERSKTHIAEICILLSFICCDPEMIQRLRKLANNAGRSMRPQDRPELNPIDYRFP